MDTIYYEKRKSSKRGKLTTKRFKRCHNHVPSKSSSKRSSSNHPKRIEPDYLSLLPDLCILAILERLPLVDLLRVARVSRRFHQLQPLVLVKIRSLQLFSHCNYTYSDTDVNDNTREKMDLLRFLELKPANSDFIVGVTDSLFQQWTKSNRKKLSSKIWSELPLVDCNFIVTKLCLTFGHITKLVLFDCNLYEIEVIELLTNWRQTLTTLVLVVIGVEFEWPRVLRTINNLPQLRHLSLYITRGLMRHLHFPVLAQLNSFYFAYHNYYFGLRRTWLYRLFAQLNPDCLQHCGFGFFSARTHSAPFVRRNMSLLAQAKPLIAQRLTRLKVPKLSRTFLSFLAANYGRSITWLDIEFDSCRGLANVANLTQLDHLTIRSNSRPYSASPLDELSDRQLIRALPQIDSVRHLVVLDFTIRREILRFFFPNARVERIVRGDHNQVDYAKPDDAINLNLFNWRHVNRHNFDQVVAHARQHLMQYH